MVRSGSCLRMYVYCREAFLNTSHSPSNLRWKYARILVCGHHLLQEANSFLRAMLLEICSLLGTDDVRGQISERIFTPRIEATCVYYPLTIFRNMRGFEHWGISLRYSIIQSRDALRPIVPGRKHLLHYIKQLFHERALDYELAVLSTKHECNQQIMLRKSARELWARTEQDCVGHILRKRTFDTVRQSLE